MYNRINELENEVYNLQNETFKLRAAINMLCLAAGGPSNGNEVDCMVEINELHRRIRNLRKRLGI